MNHNLRNKRPWKDYGNIIVIDSDDESKEESVINSDSSNSNKENSSSTSLVSEEENQIDPSAELFGNGTPSSNISDITDNALAADFSRNSLAKECSFSADRHDVRITKLKTFKTYGKVKWKNRKLSCEWESAKNIHPTARPVALSANKWGVKDQFENENDNDDILNIDMSKKEKKCLFDDIGVTPVRKNENVTKHSTPFKTSTPGVEPLATTPVCANTSWKDNLGFHRSISFVNSPLKDISNSQSLGKGKTHALSSLSILHRDKSFHSCSDDGFQDSYVITPEFQVLTLCEQKGIISIKDYVNDLECPFIRKIGEGSYGEVFERKNNDGHSIIVKVVPVDCKEVLVNGIQQMTLAEILTEMSISKALSDLKQLNYKNGACRTVGFIQLHKLAFCNGRYPFGLVKLWEHWDCENESKNDNPKILHRDQKYILFETGHYGVDLESFNVKSEEEAFSILKQVIASLAIAEQVYQFEHRDLHWGNILVMKTCEKTIDYVVSDKEYTFESCGLLVTIIDFTLSRLRSEECVIFTDLSNEEDLFQGKGDIQFNVYRDMKDHNNNEWESFNPYTNVLWIHYLAKKLIGKIMCTRSPLNFFMRQVLTYSSAYEILTKGEFIC